MKLKENQYAKVLYQLTKDKSHHEINDVVSGFLKLLIKNNQIKLASKIIQKFNQIWNENEGIVEAEIATARKLESSQVHKVESYLKEKYSAKKIIIHEKIDEKIKGGIIIKVKDEILDGSISGQLKNLKRQLER